MGTAFSFDVRDPVTLAVRRALAESVAWLHHVDEVFSTYRPDSVISRLGRGELPRQRCGPEVAEVLRLCEAAERASGGWFSHTAGDRLDPSGLVKGWAVDRASDLLHEAGAHRTCVNGGGDIRLRGEPAPGMPWRIGIADPLRPGRLVAVVTGRDCAVATSGTAERGHHVLDPHTGKAATGLLSLTLTGPDLTLTDAYATAAFAMGDAARAWTTSLSGHQALAMTRAGHVWRTPGFPGPPVISTDRESDRTTGPASLPRSYP
ncbi:FAD:protein FMN transferase [Streptomyces sp. TS71-3]|uniref:FAD:protein FMN transferase n=1 Tax=Streptomyces sp. TS71-3 TaxID=2733862 RepID=UPI001B1329F4|nr:FAD:protein FMN transferase [Streptomyces sp. TS71-3]GHJ38494.1 FAD:protein FMN transferase [Streptomyces sp. TS71-3]